MDDEIKGMNIGSTYMTRVGGIGLALLLVGLGLLAAASLGVWPARGEGGLELGGILNIAEPPTAEKKENNGSPPIPKTRSLPPTTQIARASDGAGGRGGPDKNKKETNSEASKASKSSPAPTTAPPPSAAPTTAPPPRHAAPPVAAPHQHGPPSTSPGKSRGRGKGRGIEHPRGPLGLGPPGLLKK
jgi:hypothetical protein